MPKRRGDLDSLARARHNHLRRANVVVERIGLSGSALSLLPRSKRREQFRAADLPRVCTTALICGMKLLPKIIRSRIEYIKNREDDMLLRGTRVLGLLIVGLIWMAAGAIAAEAPKEMKLYVFSSGALNLDKSIIQNGASGKVQIPVAFFLIRHPKGDVLFDCGNNDKIITDPDYWGPFVKALDPGRSPDIAIDTQLSKINVKPSDIKYVVLGHFHVDHAGNIGKFLNSTFVFQRDEIKNAFWPAPGYATFFITDDFAMLRNSVGGSMPSKYKTIELDGDLDLFGDNSIYIHRAVSHTPGSQIMVVRLPKTGTVVLTSDAVYLQENLDKNILPSVGSVYDPVGMLDAYAWIKRVHDVEGADIIFAHDPDVYKAHKHSPEYYE
jgi:glyoxylase-like metal-dependent hydrolase (beta-lactamase superfamily II)